MQCELSAKRGPQPARVDAPRQTDSTGRVSNAGDPPSRCRLQRNPYRAKPEAPSATIASGDRVYLSAVPVKRLVVSAAVLDSTVVPVNRTGAIMVVTAYSRPVAAMPGICAGCAESNAVQSCDADASRQGRCT